jgi:hypothetical protein
MVAAIAVLHRAQLHELAEDKKDSLLHPQVRIFSQALDPPF